METPITETEERRYGELQQLALDAARRGEMEILAGMVRHGLPANLCDHKGNSLLMFACYHEHLETARMLLEAGAEVDRRNDRGQTPLGGVAFKGYAEIAALLLQYGADRDADNGGGMTPLMFASMFGRTKVVELLTAHGASSKEPRRLSFSARLLLMIVPIMRTFFSKLLGNSHPPESGHAGVLVQHPGPSGGDPGSQDHHD